VIVKKIKSLIIFPIDPIGKKIGGIGTFLRNFIKFAPEEFVTEFVGVSFCRQVRPMSKTNEEMTRDRSS